MREKLISLIYKYISLQALAESNKTGRKLKVTAEKSIDMLATFLAENGVVIPVRCGECKYHVANYCTRDIKGRTNAFSMEADAYCSYGEPKEKNEE